MTRENFDSSDQRLERPDFASLIRGVLPAPSSALFTLLVVGLMLFAQSVGAWPLGDTTATNTLPSMIRYQGRLTDLNGVPQDGEFDLVFRLYDQQDKPVDQADWVEEHTAVQNARVTVEDGLFNVWLGSLQPITDTLLAGGDLYLGVTVGNDQVSDEEMSPRERLTGVPFALLANAVPDGAITTAKIQDGEVTTGDIRDDDIRGSDIKTNTITEDDIADDFIARNAQNADKLDGIDSGGFATAGHKHDSRYYTESESDSRFASGGHNHDSRYFTESESDNRFARSSHSHDGRYYTESESNSRFVNAGGDGMSGDLDMNGRKLLNVNSIQIGGQGSISDKRDSGNGGPHMVFETDDTFTFQTGTGRLRVSPSSGVELAASGDLILNTPGHLVVRQSAYTIRPDAQGGVDIGHPDFKFRAIWGQENHIGATIETGLETSEEQAKGIRDVEEGDVLVWSEGRLSKCTKPNDNGIQAVASASGHPIVLGAEVVKVIGPVKAGDMLVCSDVPGYAMVNNNPALGTVIAQALEDFDGERGFVKAMIRKF